MVFFENPLRGCTGSDIEEIRNLNSKLDACESELRTCQGKSDGLVKVYKRNLEGVKNWEQGLDLYKIR